MTTLQIYILVSQASILLPLVYGIKYYNKLNKPFKWFVWFFVFASFIEVLSTFFSYWLGNNLPLSHLFTLVEFTILLYIFKVVIPIKNKYYYSLILSFFIISFIDAFYLNSLFKFNSLARGLESLILVIASLFYYNVNLNQNQTKSLFTNELFWFSTAVLIYFSVSFFNFITKSIMIQNNIALVDMADNIHAFINIISNILFAKSFYSYKWKI